MFYYQSPSYISEDYSDSSDSDWGYDRPREFPQPDEKPNVPEGDMDQPQPDRPTEPVYHDHLTHLFLQLDANNFVTYWPLNMKVWLITIVKLPGNLYSITILPIR